jgi:cyclopropane fatty-acyl-phospholipid synthase-like methyltransferase
MTHERILGQVSRYYADKLREHGPVPQGADWNSAESQHARFEALLSPLRIAEPCTLLDYGCGYGALCDFLAERVPAVEYSGFDIAPEMIDAARASGNRDAEWLTHLDGERAFDYVVASGIFNVRQEVPTDEWERYIHDTLDRMWRLARKAMAFNILTTDHDPEYERPHLYYAVPDRMLRLCADRYSRRLSLNQDYGLFEFTLCIRKSSNE